MTYQFNSSESSWFDISKSLGKPEYSTQSAITTLLNNSNNIAIETKLNSSQTVNVNTLTKVLYTNVVYSRNITTSNGSFIISVPGFYSIDAKSRVTLTNSSGVSYLQLKIVTPSGTKISNELVNGESVVEISASISKYMAPGEVYIEIYASGSSGTVSLDSGDENWFSCTLTG